MFLCNNLSLQAAEAHKGNFKIQAEFHQYNFKELKNFYWHFTVRAKTAWYNITFLGYSYDWVHCKTHTFNESFN